MLTQGHSSHSEKRIRIAVGPHLSADPGIRAATKKGKLAHFFPSLIIVWFFCPDDTRPVYEISKLHVRLPSTNESTKEQQNTSYVSLLLLSWGSVRGGCMNLPSMANMARRDQNQESWFGRVLIILNIKQVPSKQPAPRNTFHNHRINNRPEDPLSDMQRLRGTRPWHRLTARRLKTERRSYWRALKVPSSEFWQPFRNIVAYLRGQAFVDGTHGWKMRPCCRGFRWSLVFPTFQGSKSWYQCLKKGSLPFSRLWGRIWMISSRDCCMDKERRGKCIGRRQ